MNGGAKDPITGLNPKQAQFVQEYLIDLNGTQAAIRAGYSPRTAGVKATQLLKEVNVQAVLTDAVADLVHRTQMTQDWVLDNLRQNMMGAMAEGDRHSANRALELIGRHLRMFPADPQVVVDNRQQVVNYVIGKGYQAE